MISLQYAIFYYNKDGKVVKNKDATKQVERHQLRMKLTTPPKPRHYDGKECVERAKYMEWKRNFNARKEEQVTTVMKKIREETAKPKEFQQVNANKVVVPAQNEVSNDKQCDLKKQSHQRSTNNKVPVANILEQVPEDAQVEVPNQIVEFRPVQALINRRLNANRAEVSRRHNVQFLDEVVSSQSYIVKMMVYTFVTYIIIVLFVSFGSWLIDDGECCYSNCYHTPGDHCETVSEAFVKGLEIPAIHNSIISSTQGSNFEILQALGFY